MQEINSSEVDPTDDYVTADGMSGVPIAETDAVPSVVPVAHQTLCTEDTENDIGLVPAPMTVLESGVPQNEIPVVQCPAYGIVSQHMYSSGKVANSMHTRKPTILMLCIADTPICIRCKNEIIHVYLYEYARIYTFNIYFIHIS